MPPPKKRDKARRDLWPRFATGTEAIAEIRSITDTILLSFSRGKDSWGAYLALRDFRPAFKRIIPFFYWLTPGLAVENEYLDYCETIFKEHIYRLPAPGFWKTIGRYKWQPPGNISIIDSARPPQFGSDDLAQWLWNDLGMKGRPWVALGVRAVDSPLRWAALKKSGFVNYTRMVFYPVADLKAAPLSEMISRAGVKLPADYHIWGRSFDGLDRRFTEGLKQYYPADYKRLLEFYPLADADIWRAIYGRRHAAQSDEGQGTNPTGD